MEQLINRHAAIMDKYDPQKKIALVVDEWGGWYDVEPGTNGAFLYQQNTMRDAMIAGATLNIFNNRCDRVRMANIAQAVNVLQAVILTEGEKMLLTPTYHVMEMYTVHHDALMLPVQVEKAPYVLGGDTLQAISASASRDKDGVIHVSLVNVDARNSRDVVLEFPREKFSKVTGRVLASKAIQDHNTFEHPDLVTPKIFSDMKLDGGTITVRMPSCAVVVLALR
jgi:alpha-N-arabinofuranosidase